MTCFESFVRIGLRLQWVDIVKEHVKVYSAECILEVGARLAEGPHWWDERGLLIWVDIEDSRIGLFDPQTKNNHFIDTVFHVGCVVPTSKGNLLAATSDGFKMIDPDSGQITSLNNPIENRSSYRFNDGKCDPWGRLWAGSLRYDFLPNAGSLWRLDGSFDSTPMIEGVTISNGLAWSPDRKYFYYIDTPTLQVKRFLIAGNGDLMGDGDICIQIPSEWNSSPDGMSIDRNGMLWIALWGGSAVTCWNPRNGSHLATVELPCSLVTSCCFGGSAFDRLFITTAAYDLGPEDLASMPHAGGIFMAEVGVNGMPAAHFMER